MTVDIGETTADRVGAVLAERYRIEGVIGRGGMSSVFLATDETLGRKVALKIFRPDLADADDVRRQRDEIQLLASFNHPGLVTLFDAVADSSGRAFLVLEFVDGQDLRSHLARGAMTPRMTALVGAEIAEALAYIHDRDVVHRDVKPGNILVPDMEEDATGPRAKLADFGIARFVDGARLTATGSVLGTASYLSPEQALGHALDPSSDVYSLGLVLLESLTGVRAFEGSGLESAAARLSRDPHIPDSLGAGWTDLLEAMTDRDPEFRPTARHVATRLRLLAADRSEHLDRTLRLPAVDASGPALGAGAGEAGQAPRAAAAAGSASGAGLAGASAPGTGAAGASAPGADAAASELASPEPAITELSARHGVAGEHGGDGGEAPTRVLPASAVPTAPAVAGGSDAAPTTGPTAPTVALGVDRPGDPVGEASASAAGSNTKRRRERTPVPTSVKARSILVGAAVALILGGSVAAAVALANPAEPATQLDYPAVEGDLGVHLEQLQESVAP